MEGGRCNERLPALMLMEESRPMGLLPRCGSSDSGRFRARSSMMAYSGSIDPDHRVFGREPGNVALRVAGQASGERVGLDVDSRVRARRSGEGSRFKGTVTLTVSPAICTELAGRVVVDIGCACEFSKETVPLVPCGPVVTWTTASNEIPRLSLDWAR